MRGDSRRTCTRVGACVRTHYGAGTSTTGDRSHEATKRVCTRSIYGLLQRVGRRAQTVSPAANLEPQKSPPCCGRLRHGRACSACRSAFVAHRHRLPRAQFRWLPRSQRGREGGQGQKKAMTGSIEAHASQTRVQLLAWRPVSLHCRCSPSVRGMLR